MFHEIFPCRMWPGTRFGRIAAIAGLIILSSCSGTPPTRLFLLSPGSVQAPGEYAMLPSSGEQAILDARNGSASAARTAIVNVRVPQYLERQDIMVRTDAFELQPLPNAQWAEDLTATASRTLAEDLDRLLPAYDIVPGPARSDAPVAYRLEVSLSHFEMNSPNQVVIAGRWVIADEASGKERASRNFHNSAFLGAPDPKSIVATMSGLLGGVSTEIATELQRQQPVRRR